MAKVTLDMETFKALASETRLSVLRALDERRKTLSELARELDLNKATIHEHLQLLGSTGLVQKKDEGRKWIYYELSWQGQRLLHPQESTTFSILLGLSIAAAGGGFFVLGRALEWWMAERPVVAMEDPEAELMSAPADAESAESSQAADEGQGQEADGARENATDDFGAELSSQDDSFFDEDGILAILLLITSALLAGLSWATWRWRRRA